MCIIPEVGHVVLGGRLPGLLHAVEHAVGEVEVASLQPQKVLREGLEPHEVGGDDHGAGGKFN